LALEIGASSPLVESRRRRGVSSKNFGGLVLSPHDPGEVRPWEEGYGQEAVAGAAGFLHLDCRGLISSPLALTDKNAVFPEKNCAFCLVH
jgi:hypothetical protein